jgi:putative ABC transport system permease protein
VAAMGLRLVGIGVAIGFAASLIVARVAASQIWGVSPHDPMTLSIVVGVMVLVGLAACYVPARRATRVDPMIALRCE